MASSRTTLRSDLQLLLDSFTQLKNAYLALKTFSKIQDELLQYEKDKCFKMEAEMKKITMTYSSLEKQRKGIIDELRNEKEALNLALIETKRECDRLRCVYAKRNNENEKVYRLQDELEVVKAKLVLQEEKYTEEISKRERQYTEELQKYQIMLESRYQRKNTKILKHPAIDNSPTKQSADVKTKKRKQKAKQSFMWPELDIIKKHEPVVQTIQNEYDINSDKSKITTRKKKLYCEDKDAAIDV